MLILLFWFLLIPVSQGVSGVACFDVLRGHGTKALEDHLHGSANDVAQAVSRLAGSEQEIPAVLSRYAEMTASQEVHLVAMDRVGHVLYASPLARIGAPEQRLPRPPGPAGKIWLSGKDPHQQMHLTVPLQWRGQIAGAIDLAQSLKPLNDASHQMLNLLAKTGILLTFITVALSVGLARQILRPVEEIRTVATRMASGELSLRVPESGPGNLGNLGRTINTLASEAYINFERVVAQKNKLNAILSSMVDGVVAIREDGEITFINFTAARAITAWKQEETALQPGQGSAGDEAAPSPADPGPRPQDLTMLGQNLAEVLKPAPLREIVDSCLISGTTISREITLGERFFTVIAIPLSDETLLPPPGKRPHQRNLLILLRDVTSLHQLETARSQFLGNVSHELKTPLTIIKGFVVTLVKSPGMTEEWKRYLDFIDRETDRLSRLVDDLLNLARLRSKRSQMNFTFCEPTELLKETCRHLEAQSLRYGSSLVFTCPQSLPVLLADSDRIKEIVINLVDNAFKYTPPNGTVELSATASAEHLIIRVRDTGPGIPEQEVPFLFERFFRGANRGGRMSGGTGIGLAIVKEIVDAHQGKIDIQSQPGAGTTFTISLPLRRMARRPD